MGLHTSSTLRIVLGLIVVHPDVTGTVDLYGFQLHHHPHLSSTPPYGMTNSEKKHTDFIGVIPAKVYEAAKNT